MKKITLRDRIVIAVVLPVVFLGLATVFIINQKLSQALEEYIKQRSVFAARNLAERSVEAILIRDLSALDKMLTDEVNSTEEICYSFVTDIEGNVLAHTFEGGVSEELKQANKVLPEQKDNIQLLDTVKGFIYDIAYPVKSQGRGP